MTRNQTIPDIKEADRAFVRDLIIHKDDALLVFNKPAGLAVQTRGNRGRSLDFLLWAFARSNGKRPRLVHRLDTGTSGVLVTALTKPAAANLSDSFAKRRVRKTYLALVRGSLPSEAAGEIHAPLLAVKGVRGQQPMIVSDAPGHKPALTHWRVLARAGETALMELHPKSGRMHQLRAHMRHMGCPILGDPLYGSGLLSAARLMLHAQRLVLPHPNGGTGEFSAPVPGVFAAAALSSGLAGDALPA